MLIWFCNFIPKNNHNNKIHQKPCCCLCVLLYIYIPVYIYIYIYRCVLFFKRVNKIRQKLCCCLCVLFIYIYNYIYMCISLVLFFIESLSHKDIYQLGHQMSLGVQHMHRHNYIHCDIALRNFLVSKPPETKVVIADFGLCCPGVNDTEVCFFIGRERKKIYFSIFLCVVIVADLT